MSVDNPIKPRSQKNISVLAGALLSAGISVGSAPSVEAAPLGQKYASKSGNISALYKEHHSNTLVEALDKFNNLSPDLAHAYMLTLESGWDHWQRDKKGNQIIYTGDPKQLPPKNKICDPAKDLPLVVGKPLPKLSSACAIGLAQVIPTTAQSSIDRYNLPFTLSDVLYNPKVNYLTGNLYFMDVRNNLKEKYPSFSGLNTLAATGYNMGEGNQNKTFAYYGATPASGKFNLRTYLATMPIDETRLYVPHILAQNHIISQASVASDANGKWFNRNVDAMTSYQQMRAGMQDFTAYFARSRMPFRTHESYLGNGAFNVDPSKSDFRVDPSKSDFRVDPSKSDFRVTPSYRPPSPQ